jgi:antigen flippase
MGGSSIITTMIGIVRTKFLAVLLGPSGVGLVGIYLSTTSLVSTITGMGIGESGIRQIAGASGTGDNALISRTALCVKRTAFLSGIIGALLLFFFSSYLSRLTFGNSKHSFEFAILSVAIFVGAVSEGQTALIRGMRRIPDLAKLGILGALWGTLLSIPVIYFIGEKGIAVYILIVAVTGVIASWWYSRKINIDKERIGWRSSFGESKPLLKLGFAFMLGSLLVVASQYLLRVLIIRHSGLGAAGVYQASMTLSSVYVGIILRAMITDFYPRLTAAINDIDECNSLVNKQIEVGLLLAAPVILATITFAPLVIAAFYSTRFMYAVDILRWQILGVLFQVVTWPMGFMVRAKGHGKLFFWTEFFAYSILLSFAWIGINYFDLPGVGMAFFGMNLIYGILIYWTVRKYYKFYFSMRNIQFLAYFFFTTVLVFVISVYLSESGLILNIIISVIAGLFSIKTLFDNVETMPAFLLRIRSRFGNL